MEGNAMARPRGLAPAPVFAPLSMTPLNQFCARIGRSRRAVYADLRKGEYDSVVLGTRRFIIDQSF
jgi:hypothetical protein